MSFNNQKQQSGNNSVNIQAHEIKFGLTYKDVKDIVMDVFESNFQRLSQEAAQTAMVRAEELVDSFLSKLEIEAPDAIAETKNPDMQYALYTAQKEYARTGDRDLCDMLVNLLVERTKLSQRDLIQIVINESLNVAPKLTLDQLDVLSIVFLLKYTMNNGVTSLERLGLYIDKYLLPFINNLSIKNSTYQHLEFASCGNITVLETELNEIFLNNYAGLFNRGFTEEQIKDFPDKENYLLIRCLHNSDKFQIDALNDEELERKISNSSLNQDEKQRIRTLFNAERMSKEEVKDYLLKLRPQIKVLFDVWESSSISRMTLTSVGIAIAHANIYRKINEKFDLSIWI